MVYSSGKFVTRILDGSKSMFGISAVTFIVLTAVPDGVIAGLSAIISSLPPVPFIVSRVC